MYVGLDATSVAGFSVDPSTGALSALPGSPFAVTSNTGLFPATNGTNRLFLPYQNSENVESFTVGPDGALGSNGLGTTPVLGDWLPNAAVTPDDRFLIAPVHGGFKGAAVWSVGASGALTAVSGSPFPGQGAGRPENVVITPDGRFAYVSAESPPSITIYSISASGALTETAGSPVTPSGDGFSMAITPDGRYLYFEAFATDEINAYSIASNSGALTPLPGSPFAVGPGGGVLAMDPTGRYLYVTVHPQQQQVAGVGGFAIHDDGSLTPIAGSPWIAPNAGYDTCVGADPSGKFVYLVDETTPAIFGYTIGAGGALTLMSGSPFATPPTPICMAITH